jgi:CubicO group peptidase (beta-lactamase class C family)
MNIYSFLSSLIIAGLALNTSELLEKKPSWGHQNNSTLDSLRIEQTVTKDEWKHESDEIEKMIFDKIASLPNQTQVSVALVNGDEVSFYGSLVNNNACEAINNQHSVFEIGSISKVFTTTLLASLLNDRIVDLNDEINPYFDFDFHSDTRITFGCLANHTSGLPRLPPNLIISNFQNPYQTYGKKELEEYLKNQVQLSTEACSQYTYSNLGAGLLGYTLGLSQDKTFDELVQTIIFDEFQMNSSFTSASKLQGFTLVKGLDRAGNPTPNWDFDVLIGAGGILSTTSDLSKFLQGQWKQGNQLFETASSTIFEVNDNLKIGLGWHIYKINQEQEIFWHNGGTGGYSSFMALDPTSKTGVVILSNVFGINQVMDELGITLLRFINN